MSGVPILTYHSLDDSGSVISMGKDLFERQVRDLAARGFVGIPLHELLAGWRGGGPLPERPVVLTFDDGFRNVFEHALPCLAEIGFRATVFPVAGWLGRDNDWPSQPAGVPRMPLMDSAQLRELVAAGWGIGAHTVDHPHLTDCASSLLEDEIVGGRHRLEDLLDTAVDTFSYPYGAVDERSFEIARRAFGAACGVRLARARASNDRHLLPRIDTYYLRGEHTWNLLATARGDAWLAARAAGRRARTLWRRWLG
jgi:peptidoglycan/xylan/chitin deacetylase (PgdA/CDA1 family)